MPIPAESVGSLPRTMKLQKMIADYDAGKITKEDLKIEQDAACADSIKRIEATGSPINSDGEQRASSFATYPLADTLAGASSADCLAGDGQYFGIFTDGHHCQLPHLTGGPLKYKIYAADYLKQVMPLDVKPKHGLPDFARDVAFQKIESRVRGTQMASENLGVWQ